MLWWCPQAPSTSTGAAVVMLRALWYLQEKLFASGTSLLPADQSVQPAASCTGRAILAVKPQKWAHCVWTSPQLSVLVGGLRSISTLELYQCWGWAALWRLCCSWMSNTQQERQRQPECSKCFAHQLPPILHPERLKAVCLQLCVMSCSVCHLMSSPGITRQAWMLQCHLSENSLLKLINSAP